MSRRGALKCLAWAGTGIVWTVCGGVPRGIGLGGTALAAPADGFSFVQISDSHIGFKQEVNPDPGATLQLALDRIAALPTPPRMMVHTGDVTHLSKPAEFDAAQQILKPVKLDSPLHPGRARRHRRRRQGIFRAVRGEGAAPGGWYSFDQGGVHFLALVNVLGFKPGSGGTLGADQIAWLEADLKYRSASTPIVVLAHVPLWPVYPQWGWATGDAEPALATLKRFGSVTVLNGHIHQVVQKVEGEVTFRTAMSTAFPQPAAGAAPSPGPMKVSADKLKSVLGIREVVYAASEAPAAQDFTLA